jgi:hypothetical protein
MRLLLFALLLSPGLGAADPLATAGPTDEDLAYSINWPTGLSLGEAHLRTAHKKSDAGDRWETEFTIDAAVPGFQVLDHVRSVASGDFCSIQLEKSYTHGKRKTEETTRFDQQAGRATRETKGGGKTEFNISNCARDALDYLQYLRRELSLGRLPPHQTVYYGAPYNVSVQFAGTQTIRVSEVPMEADRLVVTLKGPQVDISFEAFFAKEPSRKPVLVRVPFSLATFSMELVR